MEKFLAEWKKTLKEISDRQQRDSKRYGGFMKTDPTGRHAGWGTRRIQNRTDRGRLKDTEILMADLLKNVPDNSSIVIDIGSALGNEDPALAGITVQELVENSSISSKATIVATDVPEQMRRWEELDNKYNLNTYEVPMDYNTPVGSIVKKYSKPTKDGIVILRSSNGIDIYMSPAEASGHFSHVARELKDKKVYYLFNKEVYFKAAGSSAFEEIGSLHNRGFAHQGKGWKTELKKGEKSYSLSQQTHVDQAAAPTAQKQTSKPKTTQNVAPEGYTLCKDNLKKGCGGNNILDMQKAIVQFGKDNGLGNVLNPYEPDGKFGETTEKAVKKIQQKLISMGFLNSTFGPDNKSSVDGIFGQVTQEALNKAMNLSYDYLKIRESFKRFLKGK